MLLWACRPRSCHYSLYLCLPWYRFSSSRVWVSGLLDIVRPGPSVAFSGKPLTQSVVGECFLVASLSFSLLLSAHALWHVLALRLCRGCGLLNVVGTAAGFVGFMPACTRTASVWMVDVDAHRPYTKPIAVKELLRGTHYVHTTARWRPVASCCS